MEPFKTELGSMSIPTLESIHGMMPEKGLRRPSMTTGRSTTWPKAPQAAKGISQTW